MNARSLLWLACGLAVSAFAFYWRGQRFRRLAWPRNMEFYALSGRTQRFFLWSGWRLHAFESGNIQFLAQKERTRLAVKCLPHGFDLNAAILFEYSKYTAIRPGCLLLVVSASPPLPAAQARAAKIFLFHYKHLASICQEASLTFAQLDEMLRLSVPQDGPAPYGKSSGLM